MIAEWAADTAMKHNSTQLFHLFRNIMLSLYYIFSCCSGPISPRIHAAVLGKYESNVLSDATFPAFSK
jgi:hypothetical protein